MISIIIIALFIIFLVSEISNFIVYGNFVSKEIKNIYMNLDESKLRLNIYDPSILSTKCFITNVPFGIFSKYYINGVGTVPRWSKLHKRINEYYAIAHRNLEL